jgi:hypothetical protein
VKFAAKIFEMQREIDLDGGEITVIKALGTSGNQVTGKLLIDHLGETGGAELVETLQGLIERGYVLSSKVNVATIEDVEKALFRVNPSYGRELRSAMRPSHRRADERTRRRRRS